MTSTEKRDRLGLRGQCVAEKYLVEDVIGDGGFGLVYRATHKILREPVAIKFFFALSSAPEHMREALLEGFVREGKLMSQLSTHSASIVQARDMGSLTLATGEWVPYLVLEWLDGQSLAATMDSELMLGKAPRTLRETIGVMDGCAQALALAHSLGVAHLDIKPDNFFVCASALEPGVAVKILDFGVSKVFDARHLRTADVVNEPLAMLTPDYAAPELFDPSLGEIGPQCDVFAFALVLLELLRGGIPVMSDGQERNLDDVNYIRGRCLDPEHRPTPRALGLQVDDEVEAVFARALALRVQDRFETVGDFWGSLCEVLGLVTHSHSSLGIVLDPGATQSVSDGAKSRVLSKASFPVPGYAGIGLGCAAVAGVLALLMTREVPEPSKTLRPTAPTQPIQEAPESTGSGARCPEGMEYVPGGRFYLGSDSDASALATSRPAHAKILEPYCLDRTEVTMAAYRACSSKGHCKRAYRKSWWRGAKAPEVEAYSVLCNENFDDRPEHPVNCVTWVQARDYCQVRGFRLPLESEWEFAARGSDGRVYPWGDAPPDASRANVCGGECAHWRQVNKLVAREPLYPIDDGYAGTAPVGKFAGGRAQWGHLDLVGNLFEWTASEYLAYPGAPPMKRGFSSEQEIKHVIRGGAFNSYNSDFADPALRFGLPDNTHSHGVGFRCAADPLEL